MADDDTLAELLLDWEERHDRGDDVPAAELCAGRPDLAPMLGVWIDLLRRVAWVHRPSPGGVETEPDAADEPRPPDEPLAGRYRLDEPIGRGGFGQVWRGYDLELRRPVAVKLPRPGRAFHSAAGSDDSFLAEARRVAGLSCPGVVPVYDVGRHGGATFIVSELIDGEDLARRLASGPLGVREAVRVVAAAARHLHLAHVRGFVHRDVKPANLLVDRAGRVFVTDFGIAVSPDESAGGGGVGTLAYLPPERLAGDAAGHAAGADAWGDVYGLGVVLYESLTGRPPFAAATPAGLREAILHSGPASPRSLNRAVPRWLDRVCLRCLSKRPADRPPTAQALADALTAGRGLTTRRLVAASVAVLAGLLTLAAGLASRPNAVASPVDTPAEAPADAQPGDAIDLFNGRDLTGWTFHTASKVSGPDDAVRISGGVLALRGFRHADTTSRLHYRLCTTGAYSNFVLTLEYRFPAYRFPAGGARSPAGGCVLLRVLDPEKLAQANLRVKFGPSGAGHVRPAEGEGNDPADAPPVEVQVGEWNSLEVRCSGPVAVAIVNGTKAGEVAGIREGAGFIGLTGQGSDIEFRNVRVRPLPD